MSYSRTQHSAACEAQTPNPLISSQALYHCAIALPSLLGMELTGRTKYGSNMYGVSYIWTEQIKAPNKQIKSI